MRHADYTLGPDDIEILDAEPRKGTHGGAREGAGRKPNTYVKPQEAVDFDKARARNEAAKAQLNELKFEVDSHNWVSRAAVRQASATAMASMAQGLRGVEDNLERQGVPIDVCQKVGEAISRALEALGNELEMMAGNPDL